MYGIFFNLYLLITQCKYLLPIKNLFIFKFLNLNSKVYRFRYPNAFGTLSNNDMYIKKT